MSSQRTQKEQTRNELQRIINRSQTIISGLSDNDAWGLVLEDFGNQVKELDSNWQFVNDDKKMYEFKVTKMAAMSVLNLIENYRFNLTKAISELKATEDKVNNIDKDFDTEGAEDGEEGV